MAERVISTRIELNGETEYRQKVQDAARALGNLAAESGRAGEALEREAQSARLSAREAEALSWVVKDTQERYKLLTKAQKEMTDSGYLSISTVSTLLGKYPELSAYLIEAADGYRLADGAVQDYIATQRAEYQIALNDAQAAANAIVNAEASKIRAIDATTLAAKDQLRALAALYQSMGANADNQAEGRSYYALANCYQAAADQLEDAGKQLEHFDRIAATLGRASSGSSKKSGGSKKSTAREKTGAELDLEAYQAAVKELDHLRAMDQVSEEDYYRRKAALGDTYLKENREQRQKLDEELYQWQKGAYDRDLSALQEALAAEQLTQEAYLAALQGLRDKYFQEGTEAWRTAEEKRQQELARLNREAYDDQLADNKYFKDMDLISEAEYYARLRALRDEYLEENSEAWRQATLELHNWEKAQRDKALEEAERAYEAELDALKDALDEQLKAAKEAYNQRLSALKGELSEEKAALKDKYDADKAAAKEAFAAKKAEIQKALDLEKQRLNAILEGIDKEIQARRELREDESQDDAIARARKRLEQARAELAYARTDEDRAQWEKELVRRQEALDKAVQDKEDTAFYREKELEKEDVKEQIAAAEDKAKGEQAAAQADYDAKVKGLEAGYKANLKALEDRYEARMAQAEAEYERLVKDLQRGYERAAAAAGGRFEQQQEQPAAGGKTYSDAVKAIARANDVDLSVAQSMYDNNQRHKGEAG